MRNKYWQKILKKDERIDVPVSLVAVARSNAATSGSNLRGTSLFFRSTIQDHVKVEEKMSTVRDEHSSLMINSRSSKTVKFLKEAREMQDNTVADEAGHGIVKHSTRQEMEGILLSSDNNRVS